MKKKRKISNLTPSSKAMECNKCGRVVENVSYDAVSVKCSYCVFSTVGFQEETKPAYKPTGRPAGWRAPYTKGNNPVRGNIYNVSSYESADPYGSWLYCR